MKIPGYTKVQLSLLMILAISSVSSTALQISARANNISEENISGKKENPKEESAKADEEELARGLPSLAVLSAALPRARAKAEAASRQAKESGARAKEKAVRTMEKTVSTSEEHPSQE